MMAGAGRALYKLSIGGHSALVSQGSCLRVRIPEGYLQEVVATYFATLFEDLWGVEAPRAPGPQR